jgi:hypothetical protein
MNRTHLPHPLSPPLQTLGKHNNCAVPVGLIQTFALSSLPSFSSALPRSKIAWLQQLRLEPGSDLNLDIIPRPFDTLPMVRLGAPS